MPEPGPELEAANRRSSGCAGSLIGKDAELGAARGQLEELAGHSAGSRSSFTGSTW